MRPIPLKLKEEMSEDPFYKKCSRSSSECNGRITWEHSWIYAGRQINEKWAIITLCVFHHLGTGLDKRWNQSFSLTRATKEDLAKYPKKDWGAERRFLKHANTN